MNKTIAAPAAAALALALGLAACNQPASTTADQAGDAAAGAAADASAGATDPGGAVSPPPAAPNDAVNADANTGDTSQSAASNSFTEDQARGHIENAGYTNVSPLTKTADGLWTGTATKDGKSTSVSVDFKGAVSAQ